MQDQERGFPLTSLREINILMALDHPNIIKLKEIVVGDAMDRIYLVMEYCEHELRDMTEQMEQGFKENEIKCIMQ